MLSAYRDRKPFVFVLMPFDSSFDAVYVSGIKAAAETIDANVKRLDEQFVAKGMMDELFKHITMADVIVAETTESNANVLYEVGYAHALGKIVLLVAQHEEGIPFNLKQRQHTIYDGDTYKLKHELVPKLAEAIRRSTLGYLYSHLDPDHEIAVNAWFHGKGGRPRTAPPQRRHQMPSG